LAIVEGDFAIRVAIFEFAIHYHRPGTKSVEPFRNVNRKSEFHILSPFFSPPRHEALGGVSP
jgi:hypothetical protein